MMWKIARGAISLCGVLLFVSPSQAQKTGVEVWMHGSDIETPAHTATKALRDNVEIAVGRASDMQLSLANKGLIRVTIPHDVIIARDGKVAYLLFEANVERIKPLYRSEIMGYCKLDALEDCSAKIVLAIRSATAEGLSTSKVSP
jgi:hypothetical protein